MIPPIPADILGFSSISLPLSFQMYTNAPLSLLFLRTGDRTVPQSIRLTQDCVCLICLSNAEVYAFAPFLFKNNEFRKYSLLSLKSG